MEDKMNLYLPCNDLRDCALALDDARLKKQAAILIQVISEVIDSDVLYQNLLTVLLNDTALITYKDVMHHLVPFKSSLYTKHPLVEWAKQSPLHLYLCLCYLYDVDYVMRNYRGMHNFARLNTFSFKVNIASPLIEKFNRVTLSNISIVELLKNELYCSKGIDSKNIHESYKKLLTEHWKRDIIDMVKRKAAKDKGSGKKAPQRMSLLKWSGLPEKYPTWCGDELTKFYKEVSNA